MNTPKKGQTFTHDRFADTTWKPGPGQTWKHDAPKAQMKVSQVLSTLVYYKFADGKGSFVEDYNTFMDKFGDQFDA